MVKRFFGGESTSASNSEWAVNNYGRRLLMGSSVIRVGLKRHVLQVKRSMLSETTVSPTGSESPSPPPPSSPSNFMDIDPNVVIIMVVLLFALVCAAFINSAMRCVLRRRAQERNARANLLARGGDSSEHGLDDKTLATLPVLTFKVGENSKRMEVDCAICLNEFTENDRLRLLPKCNHVFHLDCVDMWLLSHTSCPVCRDPIKPDGDDAPGAPTVEQATASGGTIFLTRDHQGNASARISAGVEIVSMRKDETSDVRPELVRDTSWNSLSDGRYTGSRRMISREGSMDRLGSSRHSFRAQIAAIMSSEKLPTSARWQASTSSVPSTAPAQSFSRSSSAKSISARRSTEGLAAQDQLRTSGQLIEMS